MSIFDVPDDDIITGTKYKTPYFIYDDDHKLINVGPQEWSEWFKANAQNRSIERTHINEKLYVSTVFLGLDHSFCDDSPVLWETMVFRDGNGEETDRYVSEEDAIEGHKRMVDEVTPLRLVK